MWLRVNPVIFSARIQSPNAHRTSASRLARRLPQRVQACRFQVRDTLPILAHRVRRDEVARSTIVTEDVVTFWRAPALLGRLFLLPLDEGI